MASLCDFNGTKLYTRMTEDFCKIDQINALEMAFSRRKKHPNVRDENAHALHSSGELILF